MLKKLINDESGVSAIDILVCIIAVVLLMIIVFAVMKPGVEGAAKGIGTKASSLVATSSASGANGSFNLNW